MSFTDRPDFSTVLDALPPLRLDQPPPPLPETVRRYLHYYQLTQDERLAGVSHWCGSFDVPGYRLAGHYWRPAAPKGTLFLVHGYLDHVGLFVDLIDCLLARDLAVVAFDLPGHGLSTGAPASIGDFGEYVEALQQCLALADDCPRPWYALGQSTGGAVVMKHLLEQAADATPVFAKVVLSAPLVRIPGWPLLRWVHSLLRPVLKSIRRTFIASCHNDAFLDFVEHRDPFQARRIPLRWITAMRRWIEQFPQLPRSELPALVLFGDKDLTVDWRFNRRVIADKFPRAHNVLIAGAGHHLPNEAEPMRSAYYEEIRRFLGD